MDKTSRRDAVRQYKERKVPVGIFAIRCRPTGETWVGASRNLDGQRNSSFFGLRLGSHRNREMQKAWNAEGGEAAFEFSIVELLEDGIQPLDGVLDRTPETAGHLDELAGMAPPFTQKHVHGSSPSVVQFG